MLRLDHIGETSIDGDRKTYTLTAYDRVSVDTDALRRDGLYDKYSKTTKTKSLRAKKRRY